MNDTSLNLWHQFTLENQDSLRAQSLLTCLGMKIEEIKLRRLDVINAIQALSISLEEDEDVIGMVPEHELSDGKIEEAQNLALRLSRLNGALEYHQAGYGAFHSIEELKNGFISQIFGLLGNGELADAYDLVERIIPGIIYDLRMANGEGIFLSDDEMTEIEDIARFAANKERQLNGGAVLIGF